MTGGDDRAAEGDSQTGGEAAEELLDAGADLAGALVGGAVGTLGGPLGVVGGAALGVAAERAARAVMGRLSAREEARAGAALGIVAGDVKAREGRGQKPRDDGFFDHRGALRPEAEELLEGVLRHAAATYEERKLPLISSIYTAVAYDSGVVTADALYLLPLADQLTYRQFVALAVFANFEEHTADFDDAQVARDEGDARPEPSLALELDDLGDRKLIGALIDDRVIEVGSAMGTLGAVSAQRYEKLRLTRAGETLAQLSGASQIDAREREAWVRAFVGVEQLD
jgi:hypothetical protein